MPYIAPRLPVQWTLGVLPVAGTLRAQRTPTILIGPAAAQRFVYIGTPIHPFCLDFPFERSSRGAPKALDTCTSGDVTVTDGADWRRADYPVAQRSGNVSYRVLASIGSRFLVATEMWGGGSGGVSNIFWVRLGDRQIAVERDLAGGDCCAGGLSNYTVDRSSVRFDVSTTAQDIITLTGVALSNSVSDRLRSAYAACDGEPSYRYDLATGTKRLTSLTLDADIAATGSSESSGSAGSIRSSASMPWFGDTSPRTGECCRLQNCRHLAEPS